MEEAPPAQQVQWLLATRPLTTATCWHKWKGLRPHTLTGHGLSVSQPFLQNAPDPGHSPGSTRGLLPAWQPLRASRLEARPHVPAAAHPSAGSSCSPVPSSHHPLCPSRLCPRLCRALPFHPVHLLVLTVKCAHLSQGLVLASPPSSEQACGLQGFPPALRRGQGPQAVRDVAGS